MTVRLLHGDCTELLDTLPDNSVDSVVTDPPYHLTEGKRGGSGPASASPGTPAGRSRIGAGIVGKHWDGGDVAHRPELWAKVLRVLKPGGYLLACGGSRTYHRMACAIEDGGFRAMDALYWVYGTGFNKSGYISYRLERTLCRKGTPAVYADDGLPMRTEPPFRHPGADALWGWGGALKPAVEPIMLAVKPFPGTVAANMLRHGTGALNIDPCRVPTEGARPWRETCASRTGTGRTVTMDGLASSGSRAVGDTSLGRWPANLLHDGSDEVLDVFAAAGQRGAASPASGPKLRGRAASNSLGTFAGLPEDRAPAFHNDNGTASRFFYCAKATDAERAGSDHPTVKPQALMRWMVRLVTPPGGLVLDLFAGSGSTGAACLAEGRSAVLIEREDSYAADIRRRLGLLVVAA